MNDVLFLLFTAKFVKIIKNKSPIFCVIHIWHFDHIISQMILVRKSH